MAREKRKLHPEKPSKPMWPWLLAGLLLLVLIIAGIKLGGMFLEKVKKGDTLVKGVIEGVNTAMEGGSPYVEGTYQVETVRFILLKDRGVEWFEKGNKSKDVIAWEKIEGEVHVKMKVTSDKFLVFKIEDNGNLTVIAEINNGNREDIPKDKQFSGIKVT